MHASKKPSKEFLAIRALLQGISVDKQPITADTAAFCIDNDPVVVQKANETALLGHRLYILGASRILPHVHQLQQPPFNQSVRSPLSYQLRGSDMHQNLTDPEWFARRFIDTGSNPNVLLLTTEGYLAKTYTDVIAALLRHYNVRRRSDYGRLPRIIPMRQEVDLVEAPLSLSADQLETYITATNLR